MASHRGSGGRHATPPDDFRLVRMTVGSSYHQHPDDVGVVNVPLHVANALIESGQAIRLCGTDRDIVMACLAQAAEELDVTLTTKDPEVDAVALKYGARCTLVKAKTK